MPSGVYERISKKIKIVCQNCNEIREVYPCIIKLGFGKYCSMKCFYSAQIGKKRTKEVIEKMRKAKRGKTNVKFGENHHRWNGGKRIVYERKYNKRKNSSKWRLNSGISRGIYHSLKDNKNGRHWGDLVNYDIKQLKIHLEKQFDENMNWNNYGSYWHIDHITAIKHFKFTKPEDYGFQQCWALENLRPLEKKENLKKGAKLIKSFQTYLEV